jgi:hypothetical protein
MLLVPGRKKAMIQRIFSALKFEEPWSRVEQYTHNLPPMVKVITVAPGGTPSFTGSHGLSAVVGKGRAYSRSPPTRATPAESRPPRP